MSGLLGPPGSPRGPRGAVLGRGSPGPPEGASTAEKHTEPGESLKAARSRESPPRRKALHGILFAVARARGEEEELTLRGRFCGGFRGLRFPALPLFVRLLRGPPPPTALRKEAPLPPRSPPGLDLGRQVTVWNIPGSPAHPACTRARSAGEVRSHLFFPSEFRGPAQL